MIIRKAEFEDKNAAVKLLEASHIGAGFDGPNGVTGFQCPFVPAYAERLFAAHIISPRCRAIIYEDDGEPRGILLAVSFEHSFGPVWIAKESVWWIDPKYRGKAAIKMLDKYEAWAKEAGCKFAGMAGMGEDPAIAKLYLRRGYRNAETHYLKGLVA